MSDTRLNPYDPEQHDMLPFVNREQALHRINQHLTDPRTTQVPAFIGPRLSGKTALLQYAGTFSPSVIGAYLPVEQIPLRSEQIWLATVAQTIFAAVDRHNLTLPRIEEPPTDDEDDMRSWFQDVFLASLYRAIRQRRQLLLLLDNAEYLVDAVRTEHLADDTFTYLASLLDTQFGCALTMSSTREEDVTALTPLVSSQAVLRLAPLSAEDCTELLRFGRSIDKDAAASVYRATGGAPALVQRFGYDLNTQDSGSSITPDDVRGAVPTVYEAFQDYFQERWQTLDRDERLVLTAISGLLYEDPVRQVRPVDIEKWLAQTDHPLDITTIRAAVRSLEYRDLLRNQETGLVVTGGLLQRWLIEHALDGVETPETGSESNRWVWVGVVLVIFLIIATAFMTQSLDFGDTQDTTPIPTVTLVPQ